MPPLLVRLSQRGERIDRVGWGGVGRGGNEKRRSSRTKRYRNEDHYTAAGLVLIITAEGMCSVLAANRRHVIKVHPQDAPMYWNRFEFSFHLRILFLPSFFFPFYLFSQRCFLTVHLLFSSLIRMALVVTVVLLSRLNHRVHARVSPLLAH